MSKTHVVPPEAGMGSPSELPGAEEGEEQLQWSRGCRLAELKHQATPYSSATEKTLSSIVLLKKVNHICYSEENVNLLESCSISSTRYT
ncbi:Spats2-Like Protein [Manis pentadactyla]|nr:Spats2-Like Protein [Manis pentadactyla]